MVNRVCLKILARKTIYLFCFLTVIIVVTAVINKTNLDGTRGIFLKIFFQDTTVFTSGYSDKKFRQLKNGMTLSDAVELLGKPVAVDYFDSIRRLHYSSSSLDSHYSVRQLYFKNKHLVKIKHYYLID